MKKLIFLNILFSLILSSCIKPKSLVFEEKPFILKYMKKFGTLYHTNSDGQISDVFGFYTNDLNLEINLVTFLNKENKKKETNKSISVDTSKKDIYKEYKLLFFTFEKRDTYDINRIILDTSRGNYFVDTNISSKEPPTNLYDPNSDEVRIFTMYTAHSIDLYPDHIDYLFFSFFIKHSDFEIIDISFFNDKEFPNDLKINQIFLNSVLFEKNEKKYIYSASTSVEISIKLSYFPMGNYSFKIKYAINGEVKEILAMPIILDHMYGENLNDSHKKLTDAYFNGDFSVEFQSLI